MKISILMRNLNYGRFLRRSIQSALAQDYPEDRRELIVIDDGSTDESAEILRGFADRLRLVHGPRHGAVAALNAGLAVSQGDTFTLIDADDWAEPILLSALAGPFAKDPRLAFTYCDYFEEDDQGLNRRRIQLASDPFQGTAAGFLYLKGPVAAAGGYDESMMFAEYDLLAKILKRHRGAHVAKPLYHYVRHGENMTADPDRVAREVAKLRERHGSSFKIREYRADFTLPLTLRPAQPTEADARLLMTWRNDPASRGASFRTSPIEWKEHWDWYRARFDPKLCRLYFALEGGEEAGMIRLDCHRPNLWEVSIYLAPDRRYGRRGTRLLELAAKTLWGIHPMARIQARIRDDNPASQAAFQRSGFVECEPIEPHGVKGHRWERLPRTGS